MTRDEYLENALEQWKLWGPTNISCEDIKPIMELMLYHTKEQKLGIREFFVICRKRYVELNNGAEDKSSDNRCSVNNSY